jgi:hypothetical protein
MLIHAIDPGTDESGFVSLQVDGADILSVIPTPTIQNEALIPLLLCSNDAGKHAQVTVIESIESYGMPVGAEVFETVHWAGRFFQASDSNPTHDTPVRIPRRTIKLHLCNDSRARDSNIRQALLNRFPRTGGGATPQKGTKAQPGPLYGVSKHAWAALAVAVTYLDTIYKAGGEE